MKILVKILMLSAVIIGLSACSSKPIDLPSAIVNSTPAMTTEQMRKAIISSLIQKEWKVQQDTPGLIQASINVRDRHFAEIDIKYSATEFLIQYRNSRGLDYKNGNIHRNYNRWVNNLKDLILRELSANTNI